MEQLFGPLALEEMPGCLMGIFPSLTIQYPFEKEWVESQVLQHAKHELYH